MVELEARRLAEYGGASAAAAVHARIEHVRGELAAISLMVEARGATDSVVRAMLRKLDDVGDAYYVAQDLAEALAEHSRNGAAS
jgi:hypothetical protein